MLGKKESMPSRWAIHHVRISDWRSHCRQAALKLDMFRVRTVVISINARSIGRRSSRLLKRRRSLTRAGKYKPATRSTLGEDQGQGVINFDSPKLPNFYTIWTTSIYPSHVTEII